MIAQFFDVDAGTTVYINPEYVTCCSTSTPESRTS